MDRLRRAAEIFIAVFAALWIARVIFDYALDIDGTTLLVLMIILGIVGLAVGVYQARELPPMDPAEKRDAVLGWGVLAGGAASLISLFAIPLPWGGIAALAIALITVTAVRRAADAVGPD